MRVGTFRAMLNWFTRGRLAALVLILFVALLAVLLLAGGEEDDDGSTTSSKAAARESSDADNDDRDGDGDAAEDGDGEVIATIEKPAKEDAAAAKLITTEQLAEETAKAISETIALPADIEIVMGGDEEGPYYDPNDGTIQYPWWFVTETQTLLADSGYKGEELDTAVLDATRFILLHEVGHALIDRLDVPVLGKEEDAADSFAAFAAVEMEEDGELVIGATDLFAAFEEVEGDKAYEEAAFWDSHSLDVQRFYTINCLVYGADTDKYGGVVEGVGIDKERLSECEDEWTQARDSWYEVLEPSLLE